MTKKRPGNARPLKRKAGKCPAFEKKGREIPGLLVLLFESTLIR